MRRICVKVESIVFGSVGERVWSRTLTMWFVRVEIVIELKRRFTQVKRMCYACCHTRRASTKPKRVFNGFCLLLLWLCGNSWRDLSYSSGSYRHLGIEYRNCEIDRPNWCIPCWVYDSSRLDVKRRASSDIYFL